MSRYQQMYEDCLTFHRTHPEVWDLFARFALELLRSGRKRIGAGAIWERIRWETMVNPDYADRKEFKLNNNFRAFYARRFERMYPGYEGCFEKRRQISADREPNAAPGRCPSADSVRGES